MQPTLDATADQIAALKAAHDHRVAALLDANNREVERRRVAEAEVRRLQGIIAKIDPPVVQPVALKLTVNDQLCRVGGTERHG